MKILHVLDHSIPLHSGYTFRTKNILIGQSNLGWETFHITSPKHNAVQNSNLNYEDVDGLRFYRSDVLSKKLQSVPIVGQWATVKGLQKRLDALVDEIKPDIIHAHSPSLNAIASFPIGKKHSIPVVYEIRAFWEDAAVDHGTHAENGLRYKLSRRLETNAIKKANAVFTICEGLKNDIIARGISNSKVTVIPNSIKLEDFKIENDSFELRNKLGLENKTILSFIGSFYAYEGLELLIKALPELLADQEDIRLLLVGGGNEEGALKQLAGRLGLNDYVMFVGRVRNNEVPYYYQLSDICVYPRHKMRLTDLVTPLKPLEAMASKSIVVASDVGGHKELIEDGSTGLFFKAGDYHDLTQVLKSTLKQRSSWENLLDKAYQYVTRERTWDNSVQRYINVYKGLLS